MDSQSSNICLFCKNIMFDIINICLFCKSIMFDRTRPASHLSRFAPQTVPTSTLTTSILDFDFFREGGLQKKKYGFLAQKVHCLTKFYWGASDFAYYIVDLWNLCCQFSVEPSPSFLTDVLLLHHKVICGRIRSVIMPQRPTIIAPHLHCFTHYGWTLETQSEH